MQEPTVAASDAYATNFGASLRELRMAKGMSQRELAQRAAGYGVKIDPTAITRIERGERDVRLGEGYILAFLVGANLSAMATRDPMIRYHEQEAAVRQALIAARESLVQALGHLAEVRAELAGLPDALRETEWSPEEWPRYMADEVARIFAPPPESGQGRFVFAPVSPEEAAGAVALVEAVIAGLIVKPKDLRGEHREEA